MFYRDLWRFDLFSGFIGVVSWGVNMAIGNNGGPIHMFFWRYTQLSTLLAFYQWYLIFAATGENDANGDVRDPFLTYDGKLVPTFFYHFFISVFTMLIGFIGLGSMAESFSIAASCWDKAGNEIECPEEEAAMDDASMDDETMDDETMEEESADEWSR